MVHGDDYLCTGADHQVQKFGEKMKGIFEVGVAVVGSRDSQQKELVMPNRRARKGKRTSTCLSDCAGAEL